MVPKEQYGRANGLMSLMEAGPGVLAPLLAGALLPLIGLTGILIIDVLTFFFAIGALLLVHRARSRRAPRRAKAAQGSLLHEAAYGFRYIFQRPSLLGLQMVFFFGNLFSGIGFTLLAPMVLARTGSNSLIFGTVRIRRSDRRRDRRGGHERLGRLQAPRPRRAAGLDRSASLG